MDATDLAGLLALSEEAGWNQTAADWRFLTTAGILFRETDSGRTVASALVLPLGPVAWVSMVLVTATHRRRGLGTALLERCLATCAERGLTPALDATELGEQVYAPLGFRPVFALRRWHCDSALPDPFGGEPAATADLDDLAAFDTANTGLQRRGLLEHLLNRGPGFVVREGRRVVGYALSRAGRRATQVGPIVARNASAGAALAAAVMHASRPPFVLDVPAGQSDLTAALRAGGALSPRGFVRMLRGEAPHLARWQPLCAIAGPELG